MIEKIMTMENSNNNNNNHNHNHNNIINGLYPMIMMPSSSSLSHQHHIHNSDNHNNTKKLCCSSASCSSTVAVAVTAAAAAAGCYNHLMEMENQQQQQQSQQHNNLFNSFSNNSSSTANIKAKIMAHPHYPRLLTSFVHCQKVGTPPEVVARLEEAEAMALNRSGREGGGYLGEDPALDQFMEAYCEMLTKYEQELTKPFKEAMLFLSTIEGQFKALTLSSSASPLSACGEAGDRNTSSEEDIDINNFFIDPSAEDRELKGQLLRKYSGYLGSLRQEFLKKRKKGKLPKEARQQLLDWWSRHYKWPYPSESQKIALAESTGLDQKQINNWFINQRKRHWKPSEDMQFVVMDAASHLHAHPHYDYIDNVLGHPYPMDISSTLM